HSAHRTRTAAESWVTPHGGGALRSGDAITSVPVVAGDLGAGVHTLTGDTRLNTAINITSCGWQLDRRHRSVFVARPKAGLLGTGNLSGGHIKRSCVLTLLVDRAGHATSVSFHLRGLQRRSHAKFLPVSLIQRLREIRTAGLGRRSWA